MYVNVVKMLSMINKKVPKKRLFTKITQENANKAIAKLRI